MKIEDIKAGDSIEIWTDTFYKEIIPRQPSANEIASSPGKFKKEIVGVIALDYIDNFVLCDLNAHSAMMSGLFVNYAGRNWVDSFGGKVVSVTDQNKQTHVWAVPHYAITQHFSKEMVSKHLRPAIDGTSCKNCEEFFPMAEPNQKDGTLMCYQCKQDPYTRRWHK